MVLGLYGTGELTRYIVVDGMQVNPGRMAWYIFELVFMWVFYLAIIPVLHWKLRR